jgi:hypothetical protein
VAESLSCVLQHASQPFLGPVELLFLAGHWVLQRLLMIPPPQLSFAKRQVFRRVKSWLSFQCPLPLLRNPIIQDNDCETPICLPLSCGLFFWLPPPLPGLPRLSAGERRISIY